MGCPQLYEGIINNVAWGDIPWTASPHTFKLLKEAIIKLKDDGKVLLRIPELKQQLELMLPGEGFTLDQLRAVIGLLASGARRCLAIRVRRLRSTPTRVDKCLCFRRD